MKQNGYHYTLCGGGSFLEHVRHFLEEVLQYIDTANVAYALHTVEQLEVCLSSTRHLKDHLSHSSQRPRVTVDVHEVVAHYQSNLNELLNCLELLAVKWEENADRVKNIDVSQANHAPTESSGRVDRRGRPHLEVTHGVICLHYYFVGQKM